MKSVLVEYGDIKLLSISCESPDEIALDGRATHVRVTMPPCRAHQHEMVRRGFTLVDRTLDTSVNLASCKADLDRMIRIEPKIVSDRRDEVLEIAVQGFTSDSRFHIARDIDANISRAVLASCVASLDDYYLIDIKGTAAGFLALSGDDARKDVDLAAVLAKYRPSGAAVSLYAAAARDCRDKGVKRLCGTISTANPPAVDLWSFLGAKFSSPMDVYIKEV